MHGETVLTHKNWSELDSASFIRDLYDPQAQSTMRSNLAPSQCFKELISKEQRQWLYAFAFRDGRRIRHNANGTIFISGNLKQCYDYLENLIEMALPGAKNSPIVDGNFFITPSQYGLHTDSLRQEDYLQNLNSFPAQHAQRSWVPWRNIIIPLWVTPPESESQICFFKQRHLDWAHVYNHGNKTRGIASSYPIITDMSKVQFYDETGTEIPMLDNSLPYSEEHFKNFFQTPDGKNLTPPVRLTGLSPENTFNWTPGDLLVFDSCQLHSTNNGANRGTPWTLKMGLLLKFLHPIN